MRSHSIDLSSRAKRNLPQNKDTNSLMITADEGTKIAKIAIFPMIKDTKYTEIIVVPVPKEATKGFMEKSLPQGKMQFDSHGFLSERLVQSCWS